MSSMSRSALMHLTPYAMLTLPSLDTCCPRKSFLNAAYAVGIT